MEKAEVIWGKKGIFPSVPSGKFSTWVPEGEGRDWENEELPTEQDQASDDLRNLKVHKSTGPDAVHLQALREVVEAVAKPLPIVFDICGSAVKLPPNWKGKTNPSFSKMEKKKIQGQSHLGAFARSW